MQLEIKDTTGSITSASYLDLLLSIGRDSQLHPSIYEKRYDFNFHISNFPFLSRNIPSSPAYCVFIYQLIRYARACSSYKCFILRAMRLPVSYLNRDISCNAWNRHSGSFVVDTGILFSNMMPLSLSVTNVKWHPDPWPVTVTFQPIRLSVNFMTLITSLTFVELRVVSMKHLQRVWHASRERLSLQTPGSNPFFRTCWFSVCWDQFSRPCRVFSQLFTLNTPRYFLDFSCSIKGLSSIGHSR